MRYGVVAFGVALAVLTSIDRVVLSLGFRRLRGGLCVLRNSRRRGFIG
jgi:hypothetical protein